jgi:hypothetical protein
MRRMVTLIPILLLTLAPRAIAGSNDILNGSVAIEAVHWMPYPVTITSEMLRPRIVGRVTATGGTGDDIVVAVLSDADFTNWSNGHRGAALYNSGQVTTADVKVSIPEPGDYVVLLDNKFSGMTAKTVAGKLRLVWDDPPPPPPPPQNSARVSASIDEKKPSGIPSYVWMAGIGLLGAVIGGAFTALVLGRRKS